MAASCAVSGPAPGCLFHWLDVFWLRARLFAFQYREQVFPDILSLLNTGQEHLAVKRCAHNNAQELQHAANPWKRTTILPNLRQQIVQPNDVALPVARNLILVLDGLDGLQQPLQSPTAVSSLTCSPT